MSKIMYEVNWHYSGGVFSGYTVTPITITREGVLPNCVGVSITAIDANGRKFQGDPDNYYSSESAANEAAIAQLLEETESDEATIKHLTANVLATRKYLAEKLEQTLCR